ncbi:MAG: hypothetical protein FWC47_16460 [Oscillospiraceae bacterium]|nr:hypothetical protein [Oscillospiraceae bacterium]
MKKLIIFYSYTGHTKTLAKELAAKESADIAEVLDTHRPGKLKAYTLGCYAAIKGKAWPILPLKVDLKAYDTLVLFSPTWASNVPPAVNTILEQLPKGKKILVKMVSASGNSKCKARIEEIIKAKGCTLQDFEDIKR